MFFAFLPLIFAFECIFDQDCRSTALLGIGDRFCVNNRCSDLKPAFAPCKHPQECASFLYFGPLACSGTCGSKTECGNPFSEKTVYCCKPVPLKGKCNPNRPKPLNGCARNHLCVSENGVPRCAENPETTWFLGTFLSLAGNVLINVGVNFQKKSYTNRHVPIVNHSVNTMGLGTVLYILGKISSFSAYIFCNQSLLAGLSASGLISNSIFAPLINNEIFTWNDGAAILFVLAGSLIIIHNTSRTHTTYTICELISMLKQKGTVLWISFILLSIIVLYLVIKFVEINSAWRFSTWPGFLKSERFQFEESGLTLKYFMVLAYVFLSSFIASFTTLSIKILGQIADRYFNEQGPVLSFTTVFFLTTLITCTFFQIYWLNRGLQHYDALITLPIFHMSWTVLSILTAGIYFQDFEAYSRNQLKNFVLGVLVIFCGSIFLGLKIKNRAVSERRNTENKQE